MIDENRHSDHGDLEHPLLPTKTDRKLRQLCSVNNYSLYLYISLRFLLEVSGRFASPC